MKYSTVSQKILKLFAVIMMLALFMMALSWAQSLQADASNKMYWVNYNGGAIYSANAGSSSAVTSFFGTNPTAIALDTVAGKMYWTNYTADTISQANMDGSGTSTTFTLNGLGNQPYEIALDITAGKLYWTNLGDDKIYRMDMDGSNASIEEISLNFDGFCTIIAPKGIALDLVNNKIYFTSSATNEIYRANKDGTGCEEILFTDVVSDPSNIALDVAGNKMYWTSFNGGAIYQSALNGGTVTGLLAANQPAGLALDIPAGKIYWVSFGDNKIYRANLVGPVPEDVTPTTPGSVNRPHDIALDLPLPIVWDGGGVGNDWNTPQNWSPDGVPTAADSVLFDTTSDKVANITAPASVVDIDISAGYTGQITMNNSLTVSGNYNQDGGTLVVADPATYSFTVGGIFKQTGGILQQTQPVGDNAIVDFLQIQNIGNTVVKYRGAVVDTTGITSGDLGSVTVSVKAVDQAGGEYCTSDGDLDPSQDYASRCFEITADINLPADLTLYALTTELNGITLTNIYRYVAPTWTALTPTTPGILGDYSYASATTPGFSHFLMGGTDAPTAVSLQSFSAESQHPEMLALVVGALLLLAAGSFWWLRRQDE